MSRTYQIQGFDVEVLAEADFTWKSGCDSAGKAGFVAVVKISKAGAAVAVFPSATFWGVAR